MGKADKHEDGTPEAPKDPGPAAPDPKPAGEGRDAERREGSGEKGSQDQNEDG